MYNVGYINCTVLCSLHVHVTDIVCGWLFDVTVPDPASAMTGNGVVKAIQS